MSVSYDPLWKTLIDKKINRSELGEMLGFSSATIAKMGRNEYVALKVLDNICDALDCRIEDVIEIVHHEKGEEAGAQKENLP